MRWNRLLKSLLKTTVYILDQAAEQVDRVADRTSEIRDQAKRVVDNATSAIRPQQEDHTFRNLVTFAAGVGLGVGAGMLLAPARGVELRSSISDRVKDISEKVKEQVSTLKVATGTE
jgi:gas vesicle protein